MVFVDGIAVIVGVGTGVLGRSNGVVGRGNSVGGPCSGVSGQGNRVSFGVLRHRVPRIREMPIVELGNFLAFGGHIFPGAKMTYMKYNRAIT
jgi:hypothetical protein